MHIDVSQSISPQGQQHIKRVQTFPCGIKMHFVPLRTVTNSDGFIKATQLTSLKVHLRYTQRQPRSTAMAWNYITISNKCQPLVRGTLRETIFPCHQPHGQEWGVYPPDEPPLPPTSRRRASAITDDSNNRSIHCLPLTMTSTRMTTRRRPLLPQ